MNLDGDCANCLIIIERPWAASPPAWCFSTLRTSALLLWVLEMAKGLTNSRRINIFNSHPCWSGSWDVVHLLYLLVACGDPHLPSSQTIFLVLLPTILCSIYPEDLLFSEHSREVFCLCKHCSGGLEEPSLCEKEAQILLVLGDLCCLSHVFIWSIIHSSLDSFNKYWTPLLPGRTMQATET